MDKIRLGILGGGPGSLIGEMHRIASYINENYEICGGVFSSNPKSNTEFAQYLNLDLNRTHNDLDAFLSHEIKLPLSERIQVVSILTPNFLHYEMAKKLIENGFHVICEKPLTTNYEEALDLQESLKLSQTHFAVTYTYTGYPMVRQMKEMIKNGDIGEIQKVDIQYYQGWINPIIHNSNERNKIWRLDPKKGGNSCCIGDIGTHAYHLSEYVTGLKVDKILADLNYLYDDNSLDIDGTILIRYSDNVKGVIRASQIATGEENNIQVRIYGKNGSLKWKQENPNYLYYLKENAPVQVLKTGNEYNSQFSLNASKIPPGHPEGIFDAMANIYLGMSKKIKNLPIIDGEYPTIEEGARGINFIEKCISSHQNGNTWENL